MTYATYAIEGPAIQIKPGNIPGAKAVDALVCRVAAIWNNRRKRSADPRRLYRLNNYVLKDIGLTRAELNIAAMESFWRE